MNILITGAGGFIGNHLAQKLFKQGHTIFGVDKKYPEYTDISHYSRFIIADLRNEISLLDLVGTTIDQVYLLASDMGGVGYIGSWNNAEIVQNNTRINLNTLKWAHENNIDDLVFSSSACVYRDPKDYTLLSESMAFPADPCDGYGWEKIYTSNLCNYYNQNYNRKYRVVIFNNIYGPEGTYKGGREKSPAALCRKVAEAKDGSSIEVWGNGTQIRSYCYINDATNGLIACMNNNYLHPVNIANTNNITINDLAKLIIKISGKNITITNIDGPVGANSRLSDPSLAKEVLGWEAKVSLEEGIADTYHWINGEINK